MSERYSSTRASGHGDEQAARRLRIHEQRAASVGCIVPQSTRELEVRRVAFGAAGANAARPRFARARQRGNTLGVDAQRDVARRGDVRRVAEERETR